MWFWFFCRIEPGPGEIAILIRKTGKDLPSGQILALEEGQKGIQLDVLAEGRYFRNPYHWGWQIAAHHGHSGGQAGGADAALRPGTAGRPDPGAGGLQGHRGGGAAAGQVPDQSLRLRRAAVRRDHDPAGLRRRGDVADGRGRAERRRAGGGPQHVPGEGGDEGRAAGNPRRGHVLSESVHGRS